MAENRGRTVAAATGKPLKHKGSGVAAAAWPSWPPYGRRLKMANERLTVPEAAKAAGIPERTLRRYIERHGPYLDARLHGGRVTLGPEAATVLRRIRDLYAQGMNANEVDEALAASVPVTVTVTEDIAMPASEALSHLLQRVAGAMADMAEGQRRQAEEVARLREELAATREVLERQENERKEQDRRLAQLVREMQARKVPWWRRWLRGEG